MKLLSGGHVVTGIGPMGSGQMQEALNKIIEVEKQPLIKLEQRRLIQEKKLNTFQEFKSKFSELKNSIKNISKFKEFRELKVDLGDGKELIDITLDKERVQPGSFTLEIDELATRSSMISNGFESSTDPVLGIGFVTVYDIHGESHDVFIDYDDSSLEGVARKVNEVAESPIKASVIKDVYNPEYPYKLILTASSDGAENGVEFPDLYFLDGTEDIWIDDDRESSNGLVFINDFEVEVESNEISNFMQGVNLHLKQAKPEFKFTVKIEEDHEKITGKIIGVVDNINGILEYINKQNSIDENTDTRVTFAGDSSMQNVEYRLRNLMHEAFPVGENEDEVQSLVHLSNLGVSFNKDGKLDFNENKFNQAMEEDFRSVAIAFTGQMGFAHQLSTVINNYTDPYSGMLANKEKGLQQRIKYIDDNIERKQRHIDQRINSVKNKFVKMQSALTKLQSQQQYLSATLGAGGGGMVSQLLG